MLSLSSKVLRRRAGVRVPHVQQHLASTTKANARALTRMPVKAPTFLRGASAALLVSGAVLVKAAGLTVHAEARAPSKGTETVPPFSLTEPRYPPTSYSNRLKAVLDEIDPRLALTTDKQVEEARALLKVLQ